MVAQAIEADVQRIVGSLSGFHKSTETTRIMCLMQLKYWMIENNEDDLAIFRQAYADFASISVVAAISSRLAKAKKAQQELLPSKAMGDLLLEDAYIRRMFDQVLEERRACPSCSLFESAAVRLAQFG